MSTTRDAGLHPKGSEHLEEPRPTPAQKVLVERHGRRAPHPILVFLVAPVCRLLRRRPKAERVSEVLLHVERHEGAVGGEVGRDRRLQRYDRPVPETFAPQDGPREAGHRTRRALVPNPARGRRLEHAGASRVTIAFVVVAASRRPRVNRGVEPQPVTVFVLERLDLVRGQVLLDGADHRDALAWEHEGPLPSLRHPPTRPVLRSRAEEASHALPILATQLLFVVAILVASNEEVAGHGRPLGVRTLCCIVWSRRRPARLPRVVRRHFCFCSLLLSYSRPRKKKKKKLVHAASGTLLEADVLVGGFDADAKPEDQMEREGEEAEDRGASSNDE